MVLTKFTLIMSSVYMTIRVEFNIFHILHICMICAINDALEYDTDCVSHLLLTQHVSMAMGS